MRECMKDSMATLASLRAIYSSRMSASGMGVFLPYLVGL
jgi:hypothetical protein